MKSMKTMQDDILNKARWDGGWPRAVLVGICCVALARNQEHFDEIVRSNALAWKWSAIMVLAMLMAAFIWYAV